MQQVPTREEAFTLLKQYNSSDSLIRHGLAVESVMRYFATKRGENVEKWSPNLIWKSSCVNVSSQLSTV